MSTYNVTPKYAQMHLKDNNTCNINIFRDTPIQMAFKPTNNISLRKRGRYYTDNKFEKSPIIYILWYLQISIYRAQGVKYEHTIQRMLLMY